MKIFKWSKEKCRTATLALVQPEIWLNNGERVQGLALWMNTGAFMCSCGEYAMLRIKDRGYIDGADGVMYPLANVLSITWKNIATERVSIPLSETRIYYSCEDVALLTQNRDKREQSDN